MRLKTIDQRLTDEEKTFDIIEDLEKSLKVAEDLQSKVVEASSRLASFRFREAVILVWGLFIGVFLQLLPANSLMPVKYSSLSILLLTFVLILAGAYVVYVERSVHNLKRRAEYDQKGLGKLLDLIHETEKSISNSRELSTLARESLRIRLSRFGIGAKSWE